MAQTGSGQNRTTSSARGNAQSKAQSNVQRKVQSRVKSRVKRKVKSKIRKSPIIIAILIILAAVAVLLYSYGEQWFGISFFGNDKDDKKTVEKAPAPKDGEIMFHFIEVGQGDAILITSSAGNMLIDTSEKSADDKLMAYLESADVNSLKYLVLTHTDADHIGNATQIIENYKVENVLLPDYVSSSDVYLEMMEAIKRTQVNLILIGTDEDCEQSGYSFRLGSLVNTVISPTKQYEDANDMSIVIKSEYGDTSVMFTGDAGKKPEGDILSSWSKDTLKCDILKAGHHGSNTSTTQEFLDAVDPSIVVISCGKGNSYGHPHDEVMERLQDKGVTVYRTDMQGNIVFKTDGKTFTYVE
ncbi:MAG: MBL fold metallo-hydrolase [Ruminococcaceae bacterium]|nr:MBL fold metallo-hydrolase [Oscillospiraceae bacterium]